MTASVRFRLLFNNAPNHCYKNCLHNAHRSLSSSLDGCFDIRERIRESASMSSTDVTLGMMMKSAASTDLKSLICNAQFLRNELPIRLAKRALDLVNLPYNMREMPSVKKVLTLYEDSFASTYTIPQPVDEETEKRFYQHIETMLRRHRDVVPMLAVGIQELKSSLGAAQSIIDNCPFLQVFLDRFYFSRMGIRLLMAQHLSLHCARPGWHGIIQDDCSAAKVLRDAICDAEDICTRTYGLAPVVNIIGNTKLTFTFIPEFLHYVGFELIKNSMRAVIEKHGAEDEDKLPPIDIVIADGDEDIAIKVADQGGGIARKDIKSVWKYTYTTANDPCHPGSDHVATIGPLVHAPMAGFGYGLPLSRIHARAFKGDLILIPMHGHGLDAYLYLNKLSSSTESYNSH